jgi:predicted transcriptional regulator
MNAKDNMDNQSQQSLDAVAQVVASYAGRTDVTQDDILALAQRLIPVFTSIPATSAPQFSNAVAPASVEKPIVKPAIAIEDAVTDDKVYCLCCGKGFTMLKRHLKAEHGLTEDEYRKMYGLAEDFPLVAPKYSERKAAYAKKVGLGKYSRDAETEQGAAAR